MSWDLQTTMQLGLLSLSKQLWVLLPAMIAGLLAHSWRRLLVAWLLVTIAVALYASLRFDARWFGNGNEGFAIALAIVTLVAAMVGHFIRRIFRAARRHIRKGAPKTA